MSHEPHNHHHPPPPPRAARPRPASPSQEVEGQEDISIFYRNFIEDFYDIHIQTQNQIKTHHFTEDGWLILTVFVFEKFRVRLELEEGNNKNMSGDGQLGKIPPENLKILLGNWVAQWDPQYRTWFYYNIIAGQSLVKIVTEINFCR